MTTIYLKNKKTGLVQTLTLDKKRVVIGSSDSCDVKIIGVGVSPVHAILEVSGIDNKPVIYDLASESGVLLNGKVTVQANVEDKDVVGIGVYEIRLGLEPPIQQGYKPKRLEEIYNLVDPKNAIEIFDRRSESKQCLQVVMFFKDTILDVEHFADKKRIVVGPGGKKDDFTMFAPPPLDRFELVTNQAGLVSLHLNKAMKGVISKDGVMIPVEKALDGLGSKNVSFDLKDFAKIKLGDVSFFMNHTPAPPKLKRPKFRSSDPFFMKIWFTSLAVTVATVYTLSSVTVSPEIEIEQIPERIATIIYQPKTLPRAVLPKVLATKEMAKEMKAPDKVIKVTPVAPTAAAPKNPVIGIKKEEKKPGQVARHATPTTVARHATPTTVARHATHTPAPKASGQEGAGIKARGIEGSQGKPKAPKSNAAQTKVVRPSDGKPTLVTAKAGAGQSQSEDMGMVDVFKSNESTLNKVLSGGKGASSAANKLEGYSGFTTLGSGGLGAAGSARGGGGESLGLGGQATTGIGGGKRGTGLGALGSGGNILGGKGKITLESGGGAGEPIVFGSIDTAAIAREIEKHRDEIKYCYEKEINAENPNLSGRVGIRFVIGASGSVTTGGISSSTLKNANAEQCIVDVIKRIQFPPVKGGGVAEVTYPFVFKPSTK